jgi:hypothetical protein
MEFPPEIIAAMQTILNDKNENVQKYVEILKSQVPCITDSFAISLADRLASFGLMSELLRQAHRKPKDEMIIANMYISFASGIAEAYNPRSWEGDAILHNIFNNPENFKDESER